MNSQDLDDSELSFRHRLVEQAVDGPVAAVVPGHGDLQEVLAAGHGQPGLREQTRGVGGGGRQRVRRRQVHGGRGGRRRGADAEREWRGREAAQSPI